MPVKMMWEGLKERADALRRSADDLKREAKQRSARLPELALAAQEQRVGSSKQFDDAVAEADRLLAQARQAEFAAVALDERAEETRRANVEAEREERVAEMSDLRAGYDHATGEMDRALRDVEDAHRVLHDARSDYIAALRRAEFADAAGALQRRASQLLQAALWANAPGLARALGVQRLHVHRAQSMADAVGFLPEKKDEDR